MTASEWHFVDEALDAALALWRSEHRSSTRFEMDALLDLILEVGHNPMTRGVPDPDHPGFWEARSPDTNVVITYIPDIERLEIFAVGFDDSSF